MERYLTAEFYSSYGIPRRIPAKRGMQSAPREMCLSTKNSGKEGNAVGPLLTESVLGEVSVPRFRGSGAPHPKTHPFHSKEGAEILDACCGARMFWFDKNNENVLFMDNRELDCTLCDGRRFTIKPDVLGDFRDMPFEDGSFSMVVFDPPHEFYAGAQSWLAKKYGVLSDDWKEDIRQGFQECMRVLRGGGFMIFKWSQDQISTAEVLKVIPVRPLFGQRRGKSVWLVFMKEAE